jgi:hypothetical protein
MIYGNKKSLKNTFAASVEHAFIIELGIADIEIIDYMTNMLVRFVRIDAIFSVKNVAGKTLYEIADMIVSAEHTNRINRHAIHNHIGDFTLFWVGMYPDKLKKMKPTSKDYLLDYSTNGSKSYHIAGTKDNSLKSQTLRRISKNFELCSTGLQIASQDWT